MDIASENRLGRKIALTNFLKATGGILFFLMPYFVYGIREDINSLYILDRHAYVNKFKMKRRGMSMIHFVIGIIFCLSVVIAVFVNASKWEKNDYAFLRDNANDDEFLDTYINIQFVFFFILIKTWFMLLKFRLEREDDYSGESGSAVVPFAFCTIMMLVYMSAAFVTYRRYLSRYFPDKRNNRVFVSMLPVIVLIALFTSIGTSPRELKETPDYKSGFFAMLVFVALIGFILLVYFVG
jgi:magnesium-transporting ATPase (P-type)